MKKIILAAFILSSGFMAQAITINGTLKGLSNDTIIFTSTPVSKIHTEGQDEATKTETIVAKDGVVSYSLNATEPMSIDISFDQFKVSTGAGREPYFRNDSQFSLVMGPKENADFTVNYADSIFNYTVKGTPLIEDIYTVDNAVLPLMRRASNVIVDVIQGRIDRDAYYEQIRKVMKERSALASDLFKAHANSPAAEYIITKYIPSDSIDSYVAKVGASAKGSLVKPMLDAQIKNNKMHKELEAIREKNKGKDEVGQKASDFTLLDINDKPFKFSSLQGKFVILDFWGSWCGWCIKGMPSLKEYYAKHKNDLEIVGVDCNDGKAQWRAAVKKHELPWIHVYNPSNGPASKNVAALYSITGYPTKYLIDPKGNIVVKIVGEDPEFFNKVDEAIANYKK